MLTMPNSGFEYSRWFQAHALLNPDFPLTLVDGDNRSFINEDSVAILENYINTFIYSLSQSLDSPHKTITRLMGISEFISNLDAIKVFLSHHPQDRLLNNLRDLTIEVDQLIDAWLSGIDKEDNNNDS